MRENLALFRSWSCHRFALGKQAKCTPEAQRFSSSLGMARVLEPAAPAALCSPPTPSSVCDGRRVAQRKKRWPGSAARQPAGGRSPREAQRRRRRSLSDAARLHGSLSLLAADASRRGRVQRRLSVPLWGRVPLRAPTCDPCRCFVLHGAQQTHQAKAGCLRGALHASGTGSLAWKVRTFFDPHGQEGLPVHLVRKFQIGGNLQMQEARRCLHKTAAEFRTRLDLALSHVAVRQF